MKTYSNPPQRVSGGNAVSAIGGYFITLDTSRLGRNWIVYEVSGENGPSYSFSRQRNHWKPNVVFVMLDTNQYIAVDSNAIQRGYKSCRGVVKKFFKGYLWPGINLPGQQRQALDAVLFNLVQVLDLLDLESIDGRPLDVWEEVLHDVNAAFDGRCSSVSLAALVDGAQRYNIPKELLTEPIMAADGWIRNRKFRTFEELKTFSCQIGGSTLMAAVPVLGFVKSDYQQHAKECGTAIMLTQVLANCANDIRQNKILIAEADLDDCQVDVTRLKTRQIGKEFRHLVRLYAHRIEKMFVQAGKLTQYMDFDGKRTIKSLLAIHWKMLTKMQTDPECILSDDDVLTSTERLTLQSLHVLGMEGNIPIVGDEVEHHH